MFLGTTFFCGKHTFLPPATNIDNFTTLSLSNGKYDHIYLSENPDKTADDIDNGWEYDTKLSAPFDKDLEGGSIGFSVKNTDTVVIKTREKDTFDWKTIYAIPINSNEDFNILKNYPYSRNNSDNEYMLISQINGIENSYVMTECETKFEGIFIADKETIYGTIFNIEPTNITQNINDTVLELLNSKYPTVYTNSDVNYASGTTSACVFKVDADTGEFDLVDDTKYRKEFMNWLTNKKAKVLKLDDGKIYLIRVYGKPTNEEDGHPDVRRITFDWVEIGDVDNVSTLYRNNLTDVTEAYW